MSWTPDQPIVSVKDVYKSFGDVEVLKGVSMDIMKGEVICIIGPSGSGKSTLIRCINATNDIQAGSITVAGQEGHDPDLDKLELRKKGWHGLPAIQPLLADNHDLSPGLAVVLVGDDPASDVYVRSKGRQAKEVGMRSIEHRLPAETDAKTLLKLIEDLNNDDDVHGILVQLPLPAHLDAKAVINAIHPAKDVDGFHISNVGMVGTGQHAIVPCTPLGCMMLLQSLHDDFRGLTALVIEHSNVVGKPMARLLLNADCTVMVAHKSSTNIPELARMSDIVVVAAGVPGLVKADWIKPGATVIDVGINRVPAPEKGLKEDGTPKTKLVGDVDYLPVKDVAGALSPVPGGVGPMTIACLLANTLTACKQQLGL